MKLNPTPHQTDPRTDHTPLCLSPVLARELGDGLLERRERDVGRAAPHLGPGWPLKCVASSCTRACVSVSRCCAVASASGGGRRTKAGGSSRSSETARTSKAARRCGACGCDGEGGDGVRRRAARRRGGVRRCGACGLSRVRSRRCGPAGPRTRGRAARAKEGAGRRKRNESSCEISSRS